MMSTGKYLTHKVPMAVASAMRRCGLMPGSSNIIVALSGGADSVALITALVDLGYSCIAAHCNFHLRGEESERDAHHAANVARGLDVDFVSTEFDVKEYCIRHGVSVEMACRELRYDWFSMLSRQHGDIPVAVAHHADDNVETMLLNMMRGTGLSGLTGMSLRRDYIIRPMLELRRSDILEYLALRDIRYVTDSSNNVNDVLRNRIRNIILPVVYQQFPHAQTSMAKTIANLSDTENLLELLVEQKRNQLCSSDNTTLDLQRLISENGEMAPALLYVLIRDRGFNRMQTDAMIDDCKECRSGNRYISYGRELMAVTNRGTLNFITPEGFDLSEQFAISLSDLRDSHLITLGHGFSASIVTRDEICYDRSGMRLYLHPDIIDEDGLIIRRWEKGDSIAPFGMNGRTRLVSDIFSDARLSIVEKRSKWVMALNEKILWVVGYRTSMYFTVDSNTDKAVCITYIGDEV